MQPTNPSFPKFLFDSQYADAFDGLDRAELGTLFLACLQYHAHGAEAAKQRLDGHDTATAFFTLMKPTFDKNRAKWLEKCEKNRLAGAKGGRARGRGKEAQATAGEGANEASETEESWKTVAWKEVAEASWTPDLEYARIVWIKKTCPWIEHRSLEALKTLPNGVEQSLENECLAYVRDSIVPAVMREAELAPVKQRTSGREPYAMENWLTKLCWTMAVYQKTDTEWTTLLEGLKAGASGQAAGVQPVPGDETQQSIDELRKELFPEEEAVDVEFKVCGDDGIPSEAEPGEAPAC